LGPTIDLLSTWRELGIVLVGWFPPGSGFLTENGDTLGKDDFRHNKPRYSVDNLEVPVNVEFKPNCLPT
jgi:aryl-alcohol dehydrogenase-like predicted oxidoreductase